METREQIKVFKEFIEGNYLAELLDNVRKGRKYLNVDFAKLCMHSTELANLVLNEPIDTIKACELGIENIEDCKGIQVLFYNLPESTRTELCDIGTDLDNQLGRLLTFEGYIMRPSDIYLKCESAKFECPQCGNTLTILMPGKAWIEPQRCGCGRKGKFILMGKNLVSRQKLSIQEISDPSKGKRKLVSKKIVLANSLVRKDISSKWQPGQRVIVHGLLELEEIGSAKFKTSEYWTSILANNVIPVANSWDSIKLTSTNKAKNKEMAADPDLLAEFAQSLSPKFEGYQEVRESLILQHVGGKRITDANGTLEEREIIHLHLVGKPGTGKSYLAKRSMALSPIWAWTEGAGLTKVGLIGCVVKDEFGMYSLEVGPLVLADGGNCVIDEMDGMNKEHYKGLNNAMDSEQTQISKATVNQTLRTRTYITSTSNPLHKRFVDNEPIIKQLAPIPKDTLDRYDLIWVMRENINQDNLDSKYMARHVKGARLETEQRWSNKEMQRYIAHARKIQPQLPAEVSTYFSECFKRFTGKSAETDEERSHRLKGNLMRLVYAHSKFKSVGNEDEDGNVDVQKESVNYAFSLMRKSFEYLDLINKEGFAKYEDIEGLPKRKEIGRFYLLKDIFKVLEDEGIKQAPEGKILEEMRKQVPDYDDDKLYEDLEKLKKTGDIFEVRRGVFSRV